MPSIEPSWPLRGPLSLVTPSQPAVRTHLVRSDPLPWLLPTTAGSYLGWLRPRWHAEEQHLAQRPDAIGQARSHRWRARPPLPG